MNINSSRNLKNNQLITALVLLLAFTKYYIGPLSYISYPLAIFFTVFRFNRLDWILSLSLVALFFKSILEFGIINAFLLFGFHWGFFIYYLFFKTYNKQFNSKIIFSILSILTIVEGILVNTIIDAKELPNYPDDGSYSHFSLIFQRAYSFGGNASVTGVLIISLLFLIPFSKWRTILASFAIFFSASGSGILSIFSYLLYNFKKFNKLSAFIFFIILSLVISYIINTYDLTILSKISQTYILKLLTIKWQSIIDSISQINLQLILFGSQNMIDAGGDFALLGFFKSNGILGLIILLTIIACNINRFNYLSISVMMIFSLHYYIIFSGPGQVIFAYLLTINQENLSTSKN